ncbi:nuclease-related domain-containing protein [Arthrobacter oryzae]|uniref:NERD domain-containing protein n=1 Tax=Arthrobacter oryzae TaxID=409290 RepID=A0A3N0C3L2_9MICC|nr:nuclease-related domain-containing protein [Arthrobacter oryzae]RNL57259.1 NERD domain-containing protein [Arthrobacter oryzae]
MTAGNGASEQARLANDRVLRLRRQLEQAERDERAWTAGAAGERLVAEKLEELTARGWRILHDVRWPGRPKANLDHIAVGPGGVIVIDAKNWTGNVEVRSGVLRQNGCPRTRETDSALQQGAAVTALLEPQHRYLVQTWLCMVGQSELQATTTNGVKIQGLGSLTAAVDALPPLLTTDEVETIHSYLKRLLAGSVNPSLLTTADMGRSTPILPGPPHGKPSRGASRSPLHLPGGRTRRVPARAAAPRSSKRRSKPTGCLAVFVRVVLVLVFLSILQNVIQGMGKPTPAPPTQPVPGVVKTQPAEIVQREPVRRCPAASGAPTPFTWPPRPGCRPTCWWPTTGNWSALRPMPESPS